MAIVTPNRASKVDRTRVAHAPPAAAAEGNRLVITGIPLGRVARLAALFWFAFAVLVIAAAAIAMRLLVTFGVISGVDKSIASLTGLRSFHLFSGRLFVLTAAVVIVGAAVATLLTVGSVALLNCLSSMFGGIEVRYRDSNSVSTAANVDRRVSRRTPDRRRSSTG